MYLFRLVEKVPDDNNNIYTRVIYGIAIEGRIKRSQLAHINNEKYKYDYITQLTHDGIFYVDINIQDMPQFLLDKIHILRHNHYTIINSEQCSSDDYACSDIFNTNGGNNYDINPFYRNIADMYINKINTRFLHAIAGYIPRYNTNIIASHIQNTTSYSIINNFPIKMLYDGNIQYNNGDEENNNVKIFFAFINKNILSDEKHMTVYLPVYSDEFELTSFSYINGKYVINKKLVIREIRSKDRDECETGNNITAVTMDGMRGVHVHIIQSKDKYVVRQIPVFSSSPEHKIIDKNKLPITSTGYLDTYEENKILIKHELDLYREENILPFNIPLNHT